MTVGTYVGMYPTIETLKNLDQWALESGVILDEELHLTLLYSRVPLKIDTDYFIQRYEYKIPGRPIKFTSFSDAKLVLVLYSDYLVSRHNSYIINGGTSDFPVFIPHITLSRNNFFRLTYPKIPRFDIVFDIEYTEDLDLTK